MLEHAAVLKLDTQGSELSVVSGGEAILKSQRIDIIVTEFFCFPHYQDAPLLCDIWARLANLGYSLFDLLLGPHGDDGQLRYGDAIFVSNEFRERAL
jgi:hypothetical protein